MKKVVMHWTGGTYRASSYEKSKYHFLIETDGERAWVTEGNKPPEVNRSPLGADYLRHAGGFNSDAIGVSLCAMGGDDVKEKPLVVGKWPILRVQVDTMVDLVADLCETYNIKVTDKTVVTHAEIWPRFGRGRRDKWDITFLPGMTETMNAFAIGDALRNRIQNELDSRPKFKRRGCGLF